MGSTYYVLSLLITLFYLILCIASLLQLSRILYYKHNIRSFHFAFLLLTFTWSLFRILFFGTTSSIPSLFSLILFWFPVDIQFATFSLIKLKKVWHLHYFGKVIYAGVDQNKRSISYTYNDSFYMQEIYSVPENSDSKKQILIRISTKEPAIWEFVEE